jgi:hypothetical protein
METNTAIPHSPSGAGSAPRQLLDRRQVRADGNITFDISFDTPAIQAYHQQVVRKNYLVYGIDQLRDTVIEDGMLVAYGTSIPRAPLFLHGADGFENGLAICRKADILARKIEAALCNNPSDFSDKDLSLLFHQMTAYAALLLDTIAVPTMVDAIKFCLRRGPKHCAGTLPEEVMRDPELLAYPSAEMPCMVRIYIGLLGLSRLELRGEMTPSAIANFIQVLGVLDRTDILPCDLEKPDYLSDWTARAVRTNKDEAELRWEQYCLRRSHEDAREKSAAKAKCILRACAPDDRKAVSRAFEILRQAGKYGELNRRLRTHFFRFLEGWYANRNYNPWDRALPEGCTPTPQLTELQAFFQV